MALVTTHHAKKLKHRGTETTEGTRAFHSVVSVPLCFPAFGSAQVAYKKIQGVLRPTESHGMQQCEWNAHLPSPPSPIPSFSPSLVFTFSCFPFASLRLCAFAFSVLRFAPLRFLSSLTSVSSRFPLQSTDRLGQTRHGIDVDPSGCQADVFGRDMEGVWIKGQGSF